MLRFVVPPFFACLVAGCIDDSSTTLTIYSPMLLTADPAVFVGGVRCGPELRKYVVTLTDVTGGSMTVVGSSPPTDCTTLTSFGRPTLMPLHFYVADIDGYDRDDIAPTTGDAGARQMIDPATMAPVAPRWTTTCGEYIPTLPDGAAPDAEPNPIRYPTLTLEAVEVFLHGCLPMRPAEPPDAGAETGAPPDEAGEPTDDAPSNEAEAGP